MCNFFDSRREALERGLGVSSACSALEGCLYLVQHVDVVVLGGEGGVVVAQPVHHGAAGDDDGRKQGADAVLKRRQLEGKTII